MMFYSLTGKTFKKSPYAPFAGSENCGFTGFNSLYRRFLGDKLLTLDFSFDPTKSYDVQLRTRHRSMDSR